jgi:hypothetical protein
LDGSKKEGDVMVSAVRKAIFVAALSTAFLSATPAFAQVVTVPASSIQGANVLFNSGVQTGTMVNGNTQGGTSVNFTGTTTSDDIIRANGGQSRVEGDLDTISAQPNDTLGLTSLSIALSSGTFTNLEFNLFGAANGGIAYFTGLDSAGAAFSFDNGGAGYALGSGSNFFGFQGTNGTSIASFLIRIAPGSIQDVRQIRLDESTAAVGAVPEPGTWAMMLFGFGAIGAGMRRRRRNDYNLLQVA